MVFFYKCFFIGYVSVNIKEALIITLTRLSTIILNDYFCMGVKVIPFLVMTDSSASTCSGQSFS
jgi:hypothetical protein